MAPRGPPSVASALCAKTVHYLFPDWLKFILRGAPISFFVEDRDNGKHPALIVRLDEGRFGLPASLEAYETKTNSFDFEEI